MQLLEAVTTSANGGFFANFAEILLWTLWIFFFVVYLFALFAVIGDLFRDHKLNGWLKAVWIIFLIFLPFLTLLVYLIARGKSMAERSMKEASEVKAAQDAYIQQVAGSSSASPAEEIAKAKELLDSGAISAEEFEALKARALA